MMRDSAYFVRDRAYPAHIIMIQTIITNNSKYPRILITIKDKFCWENLVTEVA
jgi:hypothetical protein